MTPRVQHKFWNCYAETGACSHNIFRNIMPCTINSNDAVICYRTSERFYPSYLHRSTCKILAEKVYTTFNHCFPMALLSCSKHDTKNHLFFSKLLCSHVNTPKVIKNHLILSQYM